jgi:hypothetical protein
MVAGALVGLAVVGILSAKTAFDATPASAATGCDAHGIGNNTLTHSTNNSAYTIKGNQTTVTFDVVGKDCKLPITIVVWKAPNGTTGQPYSEQTLFYHKSATFSTGRHSMTATLPDCYFQVDTVTGTKLTGSTGQAYNYDTRQVAFMHGGTKSCTAKAVAPTTTMPTTQLPTAPPPTLQTYTIQVCDLATKEVVPINSADFNTSQYTQDLAVCQNQPTTPITPVTVETASAETLPNTGAGAVILIAIMSVAGGFIVHKTHHHRKKRKHAQHHAMHHRPAHHHVR